MSRRRNLAHALAVIGDRWTLQIVSGLLDGPKRFGELAETLESVRRGFCNEAVFVEYFAKRRPGIGLVVYDEDATPRCHLALELARIRPVAAPQRQPNQ